MSTPSTSIPLRGYSIRSSCDLSRFSGQLIDDWVKGIPECLGVRNLFGEGLTTNELNGMAEQFQKAFTEELRGLLKKDVHDERFGLFSISTKARSKEWELMMMGHISVKKGRLHLYGVIHSVDSALFVWHGPDPPKESSDEIISSITLPGRDIFVSRGENGESVFRPFLNKIFQLEYPNGGLLSSCKEEVLTVSAHKETALMGTTIPHERADDTCLFFTPLGLLTGTIPARVDPGEVWEDYSRGRLSSVFRELFGLHVTDPVVWEDQHLARKILRHTLSKEKNPLERT